MGWLSFNDAGRSRDQPSANTEDSPTNEDPRGVNYQSFSDNQGMRPQEFSVQTQYRGFSTSINHMFVDPQYERVDCCALACCGVFQNDRDRYLVTGIKPPSCCKRFWVHLVLPFWIFCVALLCAVNIDDPVLRQAFSSGLIIILVAYFFFQCMKGMWKRREIRQDLLWSKYETLKTGTFRSRSDEDSSVDSAIGGVPAYFMGQSLCDIRNAHSLCGCYASDQSSAEKIEHHTFCSRFFQCYTGACCGALCGCQLQLCGLCAVAQEGRQVEELIHHKFRRVDYVTMQPMLEYYPAIYNARCDQDEEYHSTIFTFWKRLSNFSKWVLGSVATILGVLFVWSVSGFHQHFGLRNYAVFCATLLQAYVIAKIVHWRHVQDISTDAMIKYFVSGFCLSTTLAVFFEVVVGLTMRLTMVVLMSLSGVDVVESAGYTTGMISPGFVDIFVMQEATNTSSYRDYLKVYGKDHPIVYTIYLFVNAFFLAATVEETCKYFGFRMVEHPDFLSRIELEEAAKVEEAQAPESRDGPTSFPQQERSIEARGAGITIAMVTTALGFACCENLVYIFIYGSANFDVQVVILLARSLFPVHPIAAALQSIRVCERDLEKRPNIGLGRIIFSGVLFHGMYDFLLLWIDYLSSRNGNYVDDDDKSMDADDQSDWLSFILSFVIMIGTLCYYFWASRQQRNRLQSMDNELIVDRSRLA